jgi:hypothetical protein
LIEVTLSQLRGESGCAPGDLEEAICGWFGKIITCLSSNVNKYLFSYLPSSLTLIFPNICRIVSIVLSCVLVSRGGTIMRNTGHKRLETLLWQHVQFGFRGRDRG